MERLFDVQDSEFEKGSVVRRLNRFILLVDFGSEREQVYLANSGELSTVLKPDREVLCRPVSKSDRKTDYDAFAIKVYDFYVTVKSTFANTVFSSLLRREVLDTFNGYTISSKEPQLLDHGRADFLLSGGNGKAYVEVKSCTHVEDGTAKFPDRPTKRGRRHLRQLIELSEEGIGSHLVFIVQRRDAKELRPFGEVDPEFSELLFTAAERGVGLSAVSIDFDPPEVRVCDSRLPIKLE